MYINTCRQTQIRMFTLKNEDKTRFIEIEKYLIKFKIRRIEFYKFFPFIKIKNVIKVIFHVLSTAIKNSIFNFL